MSIKYSLITTAALGIIITSSSCKKYLDVNKNPNVADTVTVDLLLPSAEVYIGSAMGVDLQIYGSIWGQYWTQNPNSSQYRTIENYQPNSNDFNYSWGLFYNDAGSDLEKLIQSAAAQNKKQYEAIALLLKAYEFQAITDAWGDVPYTEALKGLQSAGHIVNPHYDPQKTVYTGILSLIDQALGLIDPNDAITPGGDDLIYGGNMSMWKKFANTLKLRALLRLSQKDPGTAQAGIAAMYAAGTPAFLDINEDAEIKYTSTSGNKNPLYAEAVGLSLAQNLVASQTCIDSMNSNNDYRVIPFYSPGSTGFVGIRQGNYNQIVAPGSYAIPSSYVGGDFQNPASATAPVKFLTGYESKFLQAEAIVRGWASGDAQQLFLDGITASFLDKDYVNSYADYGTTADYALYAYLNGDSTSGAPPAYWGQYPASGTADQKIRHIITQKWFCMCGNEGFEAWTEWRRTGYPDFFVVSTSNLTGGKFPRRFLYPFDEVTENANFPGIVPVTTPVWWDIH
ncbi:MAG: SusD/RagB family nutrient-binding outer membrane lipoprotein [Bacteroidetes bacterium]|nr:SusD/RagB family nutrient-binding outer membrane lipoprotein [Bacteroidota bacterium]